MLSKKFVKEIKSCTYKPFSSAVIGLLYDINDNYFGRNSNENYYHIS